LAAVWVAIAIQANTRLGIFEFDQPLAVLFDQPLLALGDVLGADALAIADGFGEQVLDAQEIQTGGARSIQRRKSRSMQPVVFHRHCFGPARSRNWARSSASGKSMRTWATWGFCKRSACKLRGRFGDQEDADIRLP